MLDPTLNKQKRQRAGAIMPLFAILLPVILVFAGFAINLAYMQLTSTQLKIATDAAAHAGGRAMSIHQTTDAAIAQAKITAQSNLVAGRVLTVGTSGDGSDDQVEIIFGKSIRGDNGYGMYQFTEIPKDQVDSGSKRATSLGVISHMHLDQAFNVFKTPTFTPSRRSIATQVDRDIALVLDRSGSMLFYKNEVVLEETLEALYNTYETIEEPGYWEYAYWKRRNNGSYQWKGWYREEDAGSNWTNFNQAYSYWVEGETYTERLISWSEYDNATEWLYDRNYTHNVVYQLENYSNPNHALGDSYSSSEKNLLTEPMAAYCQDWKNESWKAPRYSRWYFLDQGVTAFLDILDHTDQEELVSLVTFSNSATLDLVLSDDYQDVRDEVAGIDPYGGTAIGDGMITGLPPIVSGEAARLFAAKTIVVLTDGENNNGEDPEDAVAQIVGQHAVTIHTVTFSHGADQDAMIAVANAGHGRHYHANDGGALVAIFEEIANNLPTILTE